MNTNGANSGQLYLFIGIGILIIILIVIPIISMRSKSKRKEPPKKVEPVPLPDEPIRPPKPKEPPEERKRDLKPETKKRDDETRVVKSFVSHEETSKGDSEITKSKTPAEAEFMLIMAWDPPVGNVRTCGWCGAEMDRSAARCPVCGRRG